MRQPMLDDMGWLYLENAAYRLELPRRPVLEALRFAHADYLFCHPVQAFAAGVDGGKTNWCTPCRLRAGAKFWDALPRS